MSKHVRAIFVGSYAKTVYRGDGLVCNIDHPETCEVLVTEEKAAQLLHDFPTEWNFPDLNLKKLAKKYIEPNSIATKGILITYPDGKEKVLPPGAEISVKLPGEAETKESTVKEKKPAPAPEIPPKTDTPEPEEEPKPEETPEKEEKSEKEDIPEEEEKTFPKHAGGPWFLLSNGEKVMTKKAATKRQKELDKEDA